ncbi:predicted protein [Uncinocarpus reesii 1704]|uniref:Uncharacterized protein n=1 Tax=Uncinocarpus reesii (strain UAMH 1704) TaxID=336963 RepID=C4JLK2_UNCRE|nr:uncharacterized protein UREG_03710 [Uncinocarpus reesii 1704]EEP78864.1 predicted protein [Uncinocarpus reesii 1704]
MIRSKDGSVQDGERKTRQQKNKQDEQSVAGELPGVNKRKIGEAATATIQNCSSFRFERNNHNGWMIRSETQSQRRNTILTGSSSVGGSSFWYFGAGGPTLACTKAVMAGEDK